MSPYEVLGVEEGADKATCKKAYRKLCMRYHPDNGGDTEMFDRVNKAWSMIDKGVKTYIRHVQKKVAFDGGLFKYKLV